MAEQEVIKHTKKVIDIWGKKEHSFWHKLKDFLLEIIIIVFAVSLSIWLHSRTEHKHQQQEVKEFLLGLKDDLKNDTLEMTEDKKAYRNYEAAFGYVASLKMNGPVSKDSLKKHQQMLFNTTGLVANSGRFEGFKSSGKIGNIENKELQNDIMDLYQENILSLIISTNYYTGIKQKLIDFYQMNTKRITDSTTNIEKVLLSDESYNLSGNLANVRQIIGRYDTCIYKIRKIITQIDKEYN